MAELGVAVISGGDAIEPVERGRIIVREC